MKVNDIRPDRLASQHKAAIFRDVAMFLDWKPDFVRVPCPACGQESAEYAFEKNGLDHERCPACGTVFLNPRPTQAMLEEFFPASVNCALWAKEVFPATLETRRQNIFVPRVELLQRLCQDHGIGRGSLIDVGAGYGIFCEEVKKRNLFDRVVAVEPTPTYADACRSRGVEVIEQMYENITSPLSADVIAAFEVIEHLLEPADFIAWVYRMLTPGGYLLLTCPNILGLETIALGREAAAVEYLHFNYFHPQSLSDLLRRVGFTVAEVATPGKLDVDLVRRCRREGRVSDAQLGPFLAHVIKQNSPELDAQFQLFLQSAKLSSNMMILARKD